MNERFKILLKQATITRYSGYAWSDEVDQEQFAELIVRECARISNEVDYTMTNQGAASAQAFMEHFGVEEVGL